jgi:hypothetical protein
MRHFLVVVIIVGPERLLLGADWPIGEADPLGFMIKANGRRS